METTTGQPLIVGLGIDNAIDVLIKPILSSYDPLRNDDLRIFKKLTGVIKGKKLVHLRKPKSVLQAGFDMAQSKAGEVKPYGKVGNTAEEVDPKPFDIWTEHYPEEIKEVIDNIKSGKGNLYHSINGTPEERLLLSAFISLIQETAGDDVYRVVFFGDSNFTAPEGHSLDAQQIKAIKKVNGVWKDINVKTALQKTDSKHIPKLDLSKNKDGGDATNENPAIKGNAIPEGYVLNTLLPKLYKISHIKLRRLKKSGHVHERPLFLVSEAIYEAYKADLKKEYKNTWQSFELHYKGEGFDTEVTIGLKWENYAVIPVYEWDLWDTELGKSNQHRAIFTARENLTIATDVNEVTGMGVGQSALVAKENPLPQNLGKVDVRATMKIDAKVAESQFIAVAC